mmetsp:Transcript_4891/g.9356  ORF Transcript_4891/g.9356 Transcript_4891/m.9356 type:complete len:191 (-) Transcript_4891:3-575(-)
MQKVKEAWHNEAVPAVIGTAGASWHSFLVLFRCVMCALPFVYLVWIGIVLADVGSYNFQKRIELFQASDCGKLHQVVWAANGLMSIAVVACCAALIFSWDHFLWVKVLFPFGTSLLVLIGVVAWFIEDSCQAYFAEHCQGIWSIFMVNTLILGLFACLAWYNALSSAPFVLPSSDAEYEEVPEREEQKHA